MWRRIFRASSMQQTQKRFHPASQRRCDPTRRLRLRRWFRSCSQTHRPIASASPELQATLRSLIPGAGTTASISRTHAENVSPDVVTTLAEKVEEHNPRVIDRMGAFYAHHPTLVKTLGSAAMMIAMRKMAERRE
jgi:hypothetical protein